MATQGVGLASARQEAFLARHAWKILLAISIILGLFGLQDMIGGAYNLQYGETVLMHSLAGTSWDELRAASPRAANLIDWESRSTGSALFTLGVLSAAICLTGFRRRQRWAWYTLWVVPSWMAFTALSMLAAVKYAGYGTPVPVISGTILSAIWATTLGLAAREFLHVSS